MANVYRGYRIIFNSTENAYRIIKLINGREVVIDRRDSEDECHMFIDDTLDGTNKEEEWERQQIL